MFKKVLTTAVLSIMVFIFYPTSSFAYRPFSTEDAGVAGKGVAQFEVSWDYLKWKNKDKENVFLFVPIYGITENIELSVEIPYLFHSPAEGDRVDGIGDINLVGKYLLINEGEKNPAFALKGVVKLNTGDYDKGLGSGDRDFSVFAVASKGFGNLTAHAQLGYTWVGDKRDENLRNIYLYGLALDYGITETFHLVGEINGNRHPDRARAEDPRNILLGVTYKLSEKFTFDFAIRRGLTTSTPDWSTTTGVSITF